MEKIGWASFVSGGGTTMDAMAAEVVAGNIATDEYVMVARLVVATDQKARAIVKALMRGIRVEVVNPRDYRTSEGAIDQNAFGQGLLGVLYDAGADVVTLNGCLVRIPGFVVDEYAPGDGNLLDPAPKRGIWNQHPGPLPATAGLYGRQPHSAMLAYRDLSNTELRSEVVTHRVVSGEYDEGPIVGAAAFPLYRTDRPETMQERALPLEHEVQKRLLWDIVQGTVHVANTIDMRMNSSQERLLATARDLAKNAYPRG